MTPSRRSLISYVTAIFGGGMVGAASAQTRPVPPDTSDPGSFVPDQNQFIGSVALGNGLRNLSHTMGNEGAWNTAVGMNALLNATDQWGQTAVGYNALKNSGRGPGVFGNTSVGYNSMAGNVAGFDNTAVGTNTLLSNETGFDNAAVGTNALRANISGSENTVLGVDASLNAQSAAQLVVVGGLAGRFLSDFLTPKLTGRSSIYIGYLCSGGYIDDAENEIVIGARASGEGPNTIVLGNAEITDTYLKGNIRLNDDLHIGGIALAGGLELGYRDRPRTTSGLERGKVYATTSRVVIDSGPSAGSSYSVYNNGPKPLRIVEGRGLTLRWAGTEKTGSRSLKGRGFADIWFNSSNEAILSGSGLT